VPKPILTILLLVISNIFMTFAWYGHLKYKASPILIVILISWAIAFFEYCFQVPANRMGYGYYSGFELKAIQEVITLTVFMFFSTLFLGETPHWNHILGFIFIAIGAFLVFHKTSINT